MSDIGHQESADLVGNIPECLEIKPLRVGARAADDEFWTDFKRQLFDAVMSMQPVSRSTP
jgi:hypothetical protein